MTPGPAPVLLNVLDHGQPLVALAGRWLEDRWRQRTPVPLRRQRGGRAAWELVIGTAADRDLARIVQAAGVGLPDRPQSFALATVGRRLLVCGADPHGALYGVGHLLRQLAFTPSRVALPRLQAARAPAGYNRGVYFATHFNNFYECEPLVRVERYIEEMALWGFDLLTFWFDMNWFPPGFWNDPSSRGMKMASRLRRIGAKARACGMRVGLTGVANEGFADQPPARLRADMGARHGACYPTSQICPSRKGGLEMILANRRRVIDLVGPLDLYVHWPYDPGGCGCPRCLHAPGRWGGKFLEIGPAIADVVRAANPGARVFVATWFMDDTERRMVYDQCDAGAGWIDGLMTQTEHARERRLDPRFERLVFPEISMFDCYFTSYGCNGANPAPQRMAPQARDVATAGCGTTLYSEGLYEDLNKAIYAGLLWDPQREVDDILREYGRYYFGPAQADRLATLAHDLEQTWGSVRLTQASLQQVRKIAGQARTVGAGVRHADGRERWHALHDRACIDLAMKQAGPGDELVRQSRALFENAGYLPAADLRRRVQRLLAALRRRRRQVDRLFDLHCRYLRRFHMEKTNMAFLPDAVLGRYEWDKLVAPLTAAAAIRDEARLRSAVSRALRRWQWFNGVSFDYLFF